MMTAILHNKFNLMLFLTLFFSLIITGCTEKEVSKKISLNKRSPASENFVKQTDISTLKFGFDLRLGPKEDVKIYLPFLRYLEQNTANKFSLRFTERYEDTVENLGRGIVHFAALGPVNCVLARKKYGAGCLVMGLNSEGEPLYHAVIFTRADSLLKDIKELKGKFFAFGDNYSTQGHIIPRRMLEDAGITLGSLKGYAFTGSHANTARAVLNGEYDAGAIQDNLARRLMSEGKIKILATSKPYPSSLICYSKEVHLPIVKNVKIALLNLDPKGRHSGILTNWDKTEMPNGFTEYRDESLKEIEELTIRYGLLK